MSHYLEIWLRGHAKDYIKGISKNIESFHPHITLVRPFQIKTEEKYIEEKIAHFCKNYKLIPFTLEGNGNFSKTLHYIPVINADILSEFRNGLENLLTPNVTFNSQKPEDEVHLHATANTEEEIDYCPNMNQYMLRLTGIKDKKIWFSYDFVTREILDREESLNKQKWHKTIYLSTKKLDYLK